MRMVAMLRCSVIAVVVAVATVGTPALGAAQDVSRLGWMAGCWELKAGPRLVHEQWMLPQGGLMLGMSRTIVRDSAREFEHLRIEARAGQVTYTAKPSGQAEASFGALNVSDTMVVFSNPSHDFPQRISYRRRTADSLLARIEGDRGGRLVGIDFPMRRVGCS